MADGCADCEGGMIWVAFDPVPAGYRCHCTYTAEELAAFGFGKSEIEPQQDQQG